MADRKKYFVTRVETATVFARNEADAETYARELFAFVGADTEDIEVEEVPE